MNARTAALAGALLVASSCSSPPLEGTLDSIEEVCEELVDNLEHRADAGSLRVLVYEIHATSPDNPHVSRGGNQECAPGHSHGDGLGSLLEHELVVRLSSHLNVVESEHAAPRDEEEHEEEHEEVGLRTFAEHYGANAVLAGDYMTVGDQVVLTLRIVELQSMLVVAAARAVLPAESLTVLLEDDHDHEPEPEPPRRSYLGSRIFAR